MTDYYDPGSLSLVFYDLMTAASEASIAGDTGYYAQLAGPAPCDVLDIGCGTGRVSLALAALGHRVIGLDRSQAMLEQARAKPGAETVAFHRADMTDFSLPRRFGLVIAPFYGFSHLETTAQRRAALATIRHHLAPRGRIVLHLVSAAVLSAEIPAEQLAENPTRIRFNNRQLELAVRVTRRTVDHQRRLCVQEIEYRLLDTGGTEHARTTEALRYGWMTEDECQHLLDEVGLQPIERRTSFTDQPGIEDILVLASTP